jgi:hypothetical protein
MDEIIGLLFLILPAIFGVVGKKLENAGEGEAPVELPELDAEELEVEEAPRSVVRTPQPEPEFTPGYESQPQAEFKPRTEVRVKAKARKTIFKAPVLEEEKPRKKDPIDPKKLVVYSEIMKPKFLE